MKIICRSDCVYSADGRCAKPDDIVVMKYMSEVSTVFCDDYLKGEADETI